jgi:hypothetical protein
MAEEGIGKAELLPQRMRKLEYRGLVGVRRERPRYFRGVSSPPVTSQAPPQAVSGW